MIRASAGRSTTRPIAGELPILLFGRLLPLGPVRPLAFVALAAVYVAAFLTLRRRADGDPVRTRLEQLFAVTAGGLLVILLGYLIYVAGLDYYRPLVRGIADRVNAVAGVGWTLCLYALIAMIATLVAQRARRAALFAALGTAGLTIALAISWLAPIAEESRGYLAADREDDRVLRLIERAVPNPPRGAVIWAFGQPVEAAPGVPVFANYWNMTAAVELSYRDRYVRSFVGLPWTRFECRTDGVVPGGSSEYPPPPRENWALRLPLRSHLLRRNGAWPVREGGFEAPLPGREGRLSPLAPAAERHVRLSPVSFRAPKMRSGSRRG